MMVVSCTSDYISIGQYLEISQSRVVRPIVGSEIELFCTINNTLGTKYENDGSEYMTSSDIALFFDGGPWGPEGCQAAWVDQSKLRFSNSDLPSPPKPDTVFTYEHLAWVFGMNRSMNYLYHQMSESVIIEDLWDDDNGFWTTRNITVNFE